jgi:hypothetical protein
MIRFSSPNRLELSLFALQTHLPEQDETSYHRGSIDPENRMGCYSVNVRLPDIVDYLTFWL